MTPGLFAALTLVVVGALAARCGFAIKHQRRYDLIAGFDISRAKDLGALAGWIGNGAFFISAVCAAGILAVIVAPGQVPLVAGAVGLVTGAAALVILVGAFSRGR